MKKQRIVLLIIALMVLGCVVSANATVLGTIEYNSAGHLFEESCEIEISIGYPRPAELWFDWSVSLGWNVTEEDVGRTFLVSSQTHESFNDFVCFLTNGVDDYLAVVDSYMALTVSPPCFPSTTRYESEYLNGIQDGVDFEGYTIDSIALTINELSLDYTAIKELGHADFSYDITYTIYGEPIPEPATVCLLAFGGILLGRKRRE